MSVEHHPNINAAGLTADIIKAIVKHSRGAMAGGKALTPEITEAVSRFVVGISVGLDIAAEAMRRGSMDKPVSVYAVYSHPKDYPNGYVVRRFEISGALAEATQEASYAPTLEALRELIPPGLMCLPRHVDDDPTIVETWL